MASSFTDLRVWQHGMRLVVAVHKATRKFPREEVYGLTSQLRRAAMSIPNCIAEGKGYKSDKDFQRFLYMSRGSCHEVQTELMIARELQYLSPEEAAKLLEQAGLIGKELNALIAALDKPKGKAASA
jgi:four helix bundle protein